MIKSHIHVDCCVSGVGCGGSEKGSGEGVASCDLVRWFLRELSPSCSSVRRDDSSWPLDGYHTTWHQPPGSRGTDEVLL